MKSFYTTILSSLLMLIAMPATACDWSPKPIKVSEFVKDKTIFWGRATEIKWAKKIGLENDKGLSFRPDIYHTVEVIKPFQGKTKKTVKVWSDNSSCGSYFGVGSINLYITEPYKNNDLYTDQLLNQRLHASSILAFLEEGLDWTAEGHAWSDHINEAYEAKCSKATSDGEKITDEDCNDFVEYTKRSNEIYQRSRKDAIALSQKKPWWALGQK